MSPGRFPAPGAPPSTREREARATAIARAVETFQRGTDREESFKILYESFFRAVQRFFARKGLQPQDCMDLTQETFIGIYKGLDAYRSEARFETWLYRIATTTYLKRLRSQTTHKRAGREIPHEDEMASEPALKSPPAQLDRMVEDERRRAMRAAIRTLPEQMRTCLTLRLYHQLKYREIAVVMKLKIDTVKAHLFQARKRLIEELGECSLQELDSAHRGER